MTLLMGPVPERMARLLTEWRSKRGPITNIMESDGHNGGVALGILRAPSLGGWAVV
jgi:hypothetical protein